MEDHVRRIGSRVGRNTRLGVALATMLLPLALLPGCTTRPVGPPPNPVVVENQQHGTDTWKMGRPGFAVSDEQTGQIKGYASSTSVNKGGRIALHVSVNLAQTFTAEVYRMGWYAGAGGRLMTRMGPIEGTRQRTCTPDATTGLIECAWSPSYTLSVPDTWASGVYLVLLTNAQNFQNYITFVVRDDSRTADLLYQQSVTTYQAYNNYPNDGATGKSLYDFNSKGPTVPASGAKSAAKVSFDRPYGDGWGSGQFSGSSWGWEAFFIGWLEQSGYDVAYSTDVDTHANGARLLNFKGFLSVGHDEYWSKEMMDAATAARDAGVDLGFFGSNTAYWQIRFEQSTAGVPDRVMVCYKSAERDPVKGPTGTAQFRGPAVGRPEQALVGLQYTAHVQNDGRDAMFVVLNSSNWVWAGTGLTDEAQVPGILGYETDRQMTEFPSPASTNYTLLSRSPIIDTSGRADYANTSVYQAPSGAWVFATGTNHWSLGLGKPGVIDSRIQRATANVLDRFVTDLPAQP